MSNFLNEINCDNAVTVKVNNNLDSQAPAATSAKGQVEVFFKIRKEQLPENVRNFLMSKGMDPDSESARIYWNSIPDETKIQLLNDYNSAVQNATVQGMTVIKNNGTTQVGTPIAGTPEQSNPTPESKNEPIRNEFNRETWNDADIKTKKNIYQYEYAKNKFMFGDKNNPKTEADWQKFVMENEAEYDILLNDAGKRSGKEANIDELMLKLQVASSNDWLLEDFENPSWAANAEQTKRNQNEYIYSYLTNVTDTGKLDKNGNVIRDLDKLSPSEKSQYKSFETMIGAANYIKLINGNADGAILCPDGAADVFAKYETTPVRAQMQYLNTLKAANKNDAATVKEIDAQIKELKKENELIKGLPEDIQKTIGSEPGVSTLAKETEKYNTMDAYVIDNINIITDTEQAKTKVRELVDDAYKKGNTRGAQKLIASLIKNNPELVASLIEDSSQQGDSGVDYLIASSVEAFEKNPKLYDRFLQQNKSNYRNSTTPEQREYQVACALRAQAAANASKNPDLMQATHNAHTDFGHDEVEKGTVEIYNAMTHLPDIEPERIEAMDEITRTRGSKKVNLYNLETAGQRAEQFQLVGRAERLQTDDVDFHNAAKKSVPTLAESNQTTAFKMGTHAAHEYLSEKDAVEVLKGYSDIINECSAKNQLEMHNDIMTSKYSEVQEHATNNIYKYDKNVQADALKTSLEVGIQTNNQKIIDSAVSQAQTLTSSDSQAVARVQSIATAYSAQFEKSVQKEVETVKTLLEQVNDPVASDETKNANTELNSSSKSPQAKTEELFSEVAKSLNKLNKLSSGDRQKVIEYICKYHPSMISTLISFHGAKDMMEMNLPGNVKNQVATIILSNPNRNNKFAVVEYVSKHPTYFSQNIKDDVELFLDGDNGQTTQNNNDLTTNSTNSTTNPIKRFGADSLFKRNSGMGMFV